MPSAGTPGRKRAMQRQRDDEGREDQGDGADHRLDLGAQDTDAAETGALADQVGRVLARDREPGEAAGELSGRHHQHRHQQHQAPVPPPKLRHSSSAGGSR